MVGMYCACCLSTLWLVMSCPDLDEAVQLEVDRAGQGDGRDGGRSRPTSTRSRTSSRWRLYRTCDKEEKHIKTRYSGFNKEFAEQLNARSASACPMPTCVPSWRMTVSARHGLLCVFGLLYLSLKQLISNTKQRNLQRVMHAAAEVSSSKSKKLFDVLWTMLSFGHTSSAWDDVYHV